VVERVTSASVDNVVVPATAESNKDVIELFTVSPQLVTPFTGRAKPRSGVAMFIL
jgi:hypothetical protein